MGRTRWGRGDLGPPPSPLGEGLGMRGHGIPASPAFVARPVAPHPPALARAIAVRLLILTSPEVERTKRVSLLPRIPAEAGIHGQGFPIAPWGAASPWTPAFAGVVGLRVGCGWGRAKGGYRYAQPTLPRYLRSLLLSEFFHDKAHFRIITVINSNSVSNENVGLFAERIVQTQIVRKTDTLAAAQHYLVRFKRTGC